MKVSDADKIALQRYMVERARLTFDGSTAPHVDLLLETLARHRHEAIEMAAKVADGFDDTSGLVRRIRDAIRDLDGEV